MCQLIIKPLGAKLPDFADVQTKYINGLNGGHQCDDGYSIALSQRYQKGDGHTHWSFNTFRTMNINDFKIQYELIHNIESSEDVICMVHLRDGGNDKLFVENCHCWSEDNVAFAMNGTSTIYNTENLPSDYSDSRFIFEKEMRPILKLNYSKEIKWKLMEDVVIKHKVNKSKGVHFPYCNRFAFLRVYPEPDIQPEIWKYGEFCEEGGCFYSNEYLLKNKYDRRDSKTTRYFGKGEDIERKMSV